MPGAAQRRCHNRSSLEDEIMLNIMLDGISILNAYKGGIIIFFIAAFGFGIFIAKRITNDPMDPAIKLLAGFSMGSIALCVVSYMLIVLAHFFPSLLLPGAFTVLFFATFTILKEIRSGWIKAACNPRLMVAGIALFLLLIARLSFLKYILLPSYSDSPIHYQIVFGFLHPNANSTANLSLQNIFSHYYHFGFHSLAAWLATIAEIAPEDSISLLGQMFLIIAPISVLFLTHVITRDGNGALFAGLLAAVGWFMPAFAVNWGKFPALSSLAVMPAALAFMGLGLRGNVNKTNAFFFGLTLLIGTTLLHTRTMVCVFLAVISLFISNKLQPGNELRFPQSIRLSALFVLSLGPILQLIGDFYSGIPTAIVWLILLPFAFQSYPGLSMGIFFYILGSWLIALAPPLLIEGSRTLLDRQFLEIMLYIPFSVIGGAGFAGMMKKLQSNGNLQRLAGIALAGGVLFTFLQGNTLYPDSYFIYFRKGDRGAFHWLEKNASEHTLILISTFDDQNQIIGTDAGIWINPLIGKNTNKLPFNTDWNSPGEIEKICSFGAKQIYIYMGGMEYSFKNAQMESVERLQPVFTAGQTVIYQLVGCAK
jgi:hypothetical protein